MCLDTKRWSGWPKVWACVENVEKATPSLKEREGHATEINAISQVIECVFKLCFVVDALLIVDCFVCLCTNIDQAIG